MPREITGEDVVESRFLPFDQARELRVEGLILRVRLADG